jgi:hypothetical protein
MFGVFGWTPGAEQDANDVNKTNMAGNNPAVKTLVNSEDERRLANGGQ